MTDGFTGGVVGPGVAVGAPGTGVAVGPPVQEVTLEPVMVPTVQERTSGIASQTPYEPSALQQLLYHPPQTHPLAPQLCAPTLPDTPLPS